MRPGTAGPADALASRILDQCERRPEAPCLHLYREDGSVASHTCGALADRAANWCAAFRDRRSDSAHAAPRPRVLIVLPHSLDLYAAFVGALLADVVPAILAHPSSKTSERDYAQTLGTLVTQSRPAVVVTPRAWQPTVHAI